MHKCLGYGFIFRLKQRYHAVIAKKMRCKKTHRNTISVHCAFVRLSTLNTSSHARKKGRFVTKRVFIWNIIFHEADKGDSNEHLLSSDHSYAAGNNKVGPGRGLYTSSECALI